MEIDTASEFIDSVIGLECKKHNIGPTSWLWHSRPSGSVIASANPANRVIAFRKNRVAVLSGCELHHVILHELAHIAVGPGHGHDSVWRDKAISMGCDDASTTLNLAVCIRTATSKSMASVSKKDREFVGF